MPIKKETSRPGPKPQPRWAAYMETAWFNAFQRQCDRMGTEGVAKRMSVSNSTVKNVLNAYSGYARPGTQADIFARAFTHEFGRDLTHENQSASSELTTLRRLSLGDAVAFATAHPAIRKKMDELLEALDAAIVEKRAQEVKALRDSGAL